MCYGTESLYIGAALAAASAATSAVANNQANKKQDQIAAEGIVKQGQLNKQAVANVDQTTKSVSQSNADAQAKQASTLQNFRQSLQQSNNISGSAEPGVPGASKAYKAAQTQATGSANAYVGNIAQSAATTEGTQLERVDEGNKLADTAGKLGLISGQSNEQNYLTQLKERAVQPNPWLQSLSGLLGAASGPFSAAAGAAQADQTLNTKSANAMLPNTSAQVTSGLNAYNNANPPAAAGSTIFGG